MPDLTNDQVAQLQTKVATLVNAKSDSETKTVAALAASDVAQQAEVAAQQASNAAGEAANTEAKALAELVSFVDGLVAPAPAPAPPVPALPEADPVVTTAS